MNEHEKVIGFVGSVEDVTERKQKREALRKSELFLDRTGKLAGIGGWEVDIKSGAIYWSDETCRIHGVEPGYVPKLDETINFYAPEARPIVQSAVETSIETGEGWDLELPMIRADGRAIWVRAVGTVDLLDGAPIRLFGVFQDVTDIVAKRQAEQDAKDIIKLATDSGGIGIWDLDLATNSLLLDAQIYRLYGLEPRTDRTTYATWVQRVHPDDLAYAEQDIADAIEGMKPFDSAFRIVWKDGTIRHIRSSGTVKYDKAGKAIRMLGANWDVTEERQLAQQLSDQHEQLRVTLQSIGDAVITTNANGDVIWLNPVAERMTGWLTAEAKDRPLPQVFHIINEETRKTAENPITDCLEQGAVAGLASYTVLISRDGTEYGIEDSASPIRNDNGEVLGVVLVFHDVTEQRRLSGEMNYRATHDALTGL
jgi:diguanylate cyclase